MLLWKGLLRQLSTVFPISGQLLLKNTERLLLGASALIMHQLALLPRNTVLRTLAVLSVPIRSLKNMGRLLPGLTRGILAETL